MWTEASSAKQKPTRPPRRTRRPPRRPPRRPRGPRRHLPRRRLVRVRDLVRRLPRVPGTRRTLLARPVRVPLPRAVVHGVPRRPVDRATFHLPRVATRPSRLADGAARRTRLGPGCFAFPGASRRRVGSRPTARVARARVSAERETTSAARVTSSVRFPSAKSASSRAARSSRTRGYVGTFARPPRLRFDSARPAVSAGSKLTRDDGATRADRETPPRCTARLHRDERRPAITQPPRLRFVRWASSSLARVTSTSPPRRRSFARRRPPRARLAREAGEYIANARDVQKRLFERAEEAVRRAEEVVGRKSEFIKGIPNTYYDEESPPEPAGCFEDLDGYTHRAEDWSPYARDVEAADRLESMEAAERLGSKPASRTRRAPAPITPSLRSRAAAEAEAREAEAESARAKLASARAKPRRSSVDVRDVRLDEYEESLATRVRSLQRAFPDAADDIAEVVRRFDEDVVGATRAVEEIEAATVSVLMRGRAPTGEGFRAWLRELAEGRGVGRGAWREEHSAFHGERRDTLDDARVVTGDENRAATPTTRRFVTRLTGAFEDWSGRGANDALVDRDDIAEVVRRFDEDAAVADARARLSFGAWRKVAGTGPIAKASERAFVEVKEETEILRTPAPAPKSAPRALADLTNAEVTPATSVKPTPGPTSVKPTPGPTPPRRFFNLIATPFARRRNRGGRDSDSPHSDWGSSESETSAESRAPESRGATSARSDWGSSESETSADASRAPESAGSTGSSAELWGSAGGRSPPPRAAQPRRNVGETTRPRSHPPVVSSTAWRCPRATRARARRSARRRTTRRRRPSPPSPRPNRRSSPLRRPRGTPPPAARARGTHPHRVFPREPRGGGVGGGASTTRTRRRHRRGFRRRGKRRLPRDPRPWRASGINSRGYTPRQCTR